MSVLELTFASGEDSLSVREIAVREAISAPFRVDVVAVSRDAGIDLDALLGQPASLHVVHGTVHVRDLGARTWHGVVHGIAQAKSEITGLTAYELTIVPAFALLAQRRDHRVFQHVTVLDIVKEVLAPWKIALDLRVAQEVYPSLEFRVQHGESDFDFVSRLLEEAGIAYLFDDEAAGPALTLVDRPQGAPPRPGGAIPFVDNPNEASEREYVTRVGIVREVRPGARVLGDNDFRNPEVPISASARAAGPESRLEHYSYSTGGHVVLGQKGGGTPVADQRGVARHSEAWASESAGRRLAADRSGAQRFAYGTNVTDLRPGTVFSIEHPHAAISGRPLLATDLRIDGSPDKEWSVTGRAVLAEVPYRPPRLTPKPRARGVQTATVVGPAGQEIHADEFGRVRVRFPWDRSGAQGDTTSCWLRVSQPWAGAGFGWKAIPRVGQEVVVAFFEDDPDQPVILSGAYNGTHPVPLPLPGRAPVTTWQSRSSPGGDGQNEVLLDDAAGRELFYLQAEQDLTQLVRRNEAATTVRNLSKLVKGDETQTTGKERVKIVWRERRKLVKGDRTIRVEGSRATVFRKRLDVTVEGSSRTEVGGDADTSIHGAERAIVGGAESGVVGADSHEQTRKRQALDVKGDVHLLSDDAGVIEGFQAITLKTPGGFVFIDSSGIVLKGPLVLINSGGVAGAGKGSHPAAPEPPREAKAFEPPMPYGAPNPDGDVAPLPEGELTAAPPPVGVELTWIEVVLVSVDGAPVGGERYRIVTPDGKKREGHLDASGRARVEGIVPGECQVTFPNLGPEDWE